MVSGPPLWSCCGWERIRAQKSIFLSIISKCKGVHRCQVLQLDGEEEEEEMGGGRRRRGGGRNWQGLMGKIGSASTQALTSSEETSPRRICDWTHSLRGIQDQQFSSRESAVMSKISAGKHNTSPAALRLCHSIKERSPDHQFTQPPHLFWFWFANKSAQKPKTMYSRLTEA